MPYDVYVVVTRPDGPESKAMLQRYLDHADRAGIAALVDDWLVRPGRKCDY